MAKRLGVTQKQARRLVRVSFAKVAEYQVRGVIHFHAIICLDGPPTDGAGYASREKVTAGFWAAKHRDPDVSRVMAGPGWAIDPLPGLNGLGGAA